MKLSTAAMIGVPASVLLSIAMCHLMQPTSMIGFVIGLSWGFLCFGIAVAVSEKTP